MKKNECNYCKKHTGGTCLICGTLSCDSNKETVPSILYAAEFLLYAFHFESGDGGYGSESAPPRPLMMLVAEG